MNNLLNTVARIVGDETHFPLKSPLSLRRIAEVVFKSY